MLDTFLFGISSNLSQQKEKIYAYNFRCWALFYNKFEETPNEKVVNMSKLTKPYFNLIRAVECHIFCQNAIFVDN